MNSYLNFVQIQETISRLLDLNLIKETKFAIKFYKTKSKPKFLAINLKMLNIILPIFIIMSCYWKSKNAQNFQKYFSAFDKMFSLIQKINAESWIDNFEQDQKYLMQIQKHFQKIKAYFEKSKIERIMQINDQSDDDSHCAAFINAKLRSKSNLLLKLKNFNDLQIRLGINYSSSKNRWNFEIMDIAQK